MSNIKEKLETLEELIKWDLFETNWTYFIKDSKESNFIKTEIFKSSVSSSPIKKDKNKILESLDDNLDAIIEFQIRWEYKKLSNIVSKKNYEINDIINILYHNIFILWKHEIKLLDDRIDFFEIENIYEKIFDKKEEINNLKSLTLNINEEEKSIFNNIITILLDYIDFIKHKIEYKIHYRNSKKRKDILDKYLKDEKYKNLSNRHFVAYNLIDLYWEDNSSIAYDDLLGSLKDLSIQWLSWIIKWDDILKWWDYIRDLQYTNFLFLLRFIRNIYIKNFINNDDSYDKINEILTLLYSILENKFIKIKADNKYNKELKNKNIPFLINNILWIIDFLIENSNYTENKNDKIILLLKSYIDKIEKIFIREKNQFNYTYFTFFKLSDFYYKLHIIYKNTKGNEFLLKSKEFCKKSIDLYYSYWETFSPFIIEFSLLRKDNNFLSFSWYLSPHRSLTKDKLKKLNLDLIKEESIYKLQESNEKFKHQYDEIKNKIDNNVVKNVEVLWVFSAIVLFVSGSIQLFWRLTDINSAITLFLMFWWTILLIFSIINIKDFKSLNIKSFCENNYKFLSIITLSILLFWLGIMINVFWLGKDNLFNNDEIEKAKLEIKKSDIENTTKENKLYFKELENKINNNASDIEILRKKENITINNSNSSDTKNKNTDLWIDLNRTNIDNKLENLTK